MTELDAITVMLNHVRVVEDVDAALEFLGIPAPGA